MFNDRIKLTAAVLEGRKTMTRRVIKCPKNYDDFKVYKTAYGEHRFLLCDAAGFLVDEIDWRELARYQVGEIVAIAQRYCDILHCADVPKGEEKGWGNKMFVKAELMPHHIKITGITVERLQDISDEDCLREGIGTFKSPYYFDPCYHLPITSDKVIYYKTPREAFAALIDKVSGKGTWDSNPWVFAYEFKLID